LVEESNGDLRKIIIIIIQEQGKVECGKNFIDSNWSEDPTTCSFSENWIHVREKK